MMGTGSLIFTAFCCHVRVSRP